MIDRALALIGKNETIVRHDAVPSIHAHLSTKKGRNVGQLKDNMSAKATYSLSLKNSRSQAILFNVEPWGEQYSMPPDAIFFITTEAPICGTIHIEYEEDGISVWATTSIQLFHDDVELGAGSRPRQQPPPIPQKHSC